VLVFFSTFVYFWLTKFSWPSATTLYWNSRVLN
jgi:hypothetical protein